MSVISIDKLYTNYDILTDAKNKIGEHTKEYEEIIAAVKGGEKEKKLASQFIAKFFKHFPSLQYQAIEALFDICEDDDMSIRKQAIKVLPSLCKDTKEHITKVVDVLAQLLQLEDPQEHTIATNSLLEIIKIDAMPTIKGILKQITTAEYLVREKCIKFLSKIHSLGSDIVTKDIEDYIIGEIKKIISNTSPDDFMGLMEFLKSTAFSRTPLGQHELTEIALEQADLNAEFNHDDKEDTLDRLMVCVNYVLPYLSSKNQSTKLVEYICDKILPHFETIGDMERGDIYQRNLLKQLAELSTHCGQLTNPTQKVENIFAVLKMHLSLPPEDKDVTVFPNQDYGRVEALLYTFHRLARQCPDFLNANPEVLKDFRLRLQYISRGVQGCISALKDGSDIKKEDESKRKNIYKLTTNINTLIKDLFYTPPSYKSEVQLSWKIEDTPKKTMEPTKTTLGKRHAPITIEFEKNNSSSAGKHSRRSSDNVRLYTPPSGKFSNNFQNQNRKPMRGGRGRIGGRGRGRGRNNWRN